MPLLVSVPGLTHLTAIWSKVPLRPEFVESFPDVLFGDKPDQAELDAWVSEATGGLITEFPIKIKQTDLLALADALTVIGTWATPFSQHLTKTADFLNGGGDTVTATFMEGGFNGRTFARHDDIRIWTQPTERIGRPAPSTEMRFAIGEEGTARSAVLEQILQVPTPSDVDSVIVRLPKFKLRQRTDLVGRLLNEATPLSLTNEANFSGISVVGLKVAQAAQACLISVEEKGYEASAVTAITMERLGARPPRERVIEHLNFDRPFAFAVIERTTNLPLFVGWIDDPSSLS